MGSRLMVKHPFYILHAILFRYFCKYDWKIGNKVIYASKYLQLCQHQLYVRNTQKIGGGWPQLAVLFCILEVIHHTRAKDDEHIILRTSPLTMPIYFDNQLTIVPVQPLKGQWFIRIDQFWVTSCAALLGQTEAWQAVQSGMLSNAQAWLTAHQHAELNSLAKCFPFTLTLDTHIQLWISPYIEICPTHSFATFLHPHRRLNENK